MHSTDHQRQNRNLHKMESELDFWPGVLQFAQRVWLQTDSMTLRVSDIILLCSVNAKLMIQDFYWEDWSQTEQHVYVSTKLVLSWASSPSLSSSQFSWRSCVSAGGLHGAGGWRWDLRTCWTASPPVFLHLSACSLHWCSQCGTCGMFSSPAGEAWADNSTDLPLTGCTVITFYHIGYYRLN